MPVLALGVSYRRAPVELLERLSFSQADLPKAYHHLTRLEAVEGSIILSTCNRVEVYAEVPRYHQGFLDLKRFLSESREVPADEFADPLYAHYEEDAAEHLFSVASGIDSMVVGEPQIHSQVRQAFRAAEAEGAAGPDLASLFREALRVGRRARRETGIGASPAAFVEAGARLAAEHLGGLGGRSVLVVGAGEMSALAIRSLRDRGVDPVTVLNRTPERAARLAGKVGGAHGSLEHLTAAMSTADLVVTSTGATGLVLHRGMVERATAGRKGPLFLLDLAVPRDVDPGAGDLPGVRVADIDDLREVLAERQGELRAEVERVAAIVAEETRRFGRRQREARLAPLIKALHDRGDEVRALELRRLASRLRDLSDRERQAVEALAAGIVAKLLHDPVVRLKAGAGTAEGEAQARALAELFGLDVGD
ncbi:MAG: glutamyl-tRNA reductase [Actinomycetota bacterium]